MRDNPPVSHKRLLPVLKTKDGKPSRKKWAASSARRALKRWAKKGRTVDFKKYARAFLYVKPGKENDLTGYKLPIATIVAGKLTAIPHGIYAAAGVMEGARSRVKGMSKADAAAIMRTLERYYKKMGEVAPWPPYGPGTPAWSYGSRGKAKGPQGELALENPRERITNAHLEGLLRRINSITGNADEAWTRDAGGQYRANVGAYVIDSAYGGVALGQLVTDGGGQRDIIPRGTKRELYHRMAAFAAGLEAAEAGRRNPHGPPHARGNFTEQQHRDLAENWGQTEREWMRTGLHREARDASAQRRAHLASTESDAFSFDESLRESRGGYYDGGARGNFSRKRHRQLQELWDDAGRDRTTAGRYLDELGDEEGADYSHAAAAADYARAHAHRASHGGYASAEQEAREAGSRGRYDAALAAHRAAGGNPPAKWKRHAPGAYYLGTIAEVRAYHPRKDSYARHLAAEYEEQHGSKVPKGTKWLTHEDGMDAGFLVSAHRTLKAAKRRGNQALAAHRGENR